jgi:hypothetical protein
MQGSYFAKIAKLRVEKGKKCVIKMVNFDELL